MEDGRLRLLHQLKCMEMYVVGCGRCGSKKGEARVWVKKQFLYWAYSHLQCRCDTHLSCFLVIKVYSFFQFEVLWQLLRAFADSFHRPDTASSYHLLFSSVVYCKMRTTVAAIVVAIASSFNVVDAVYGSPTKNVRLGNLMVLIAPIAALLTLSLELLPWWQTCSLAIWVMRMVTLRKHPLQTFAMRVPTQQKNFLWLAITLLDVLSISSEVSKTSLT